MNGYRVRGTVRSEDKGEYLKKLYDGVGEFEYVIVEDIAEVSKRGRGCGRLGTSIDGCLVDDPGSPVHSTRPSRGSMESVSPAPFS